MRAIGILLVVALAAGSARLLACDWSCIEHTRAVASQQPSCHEEASQTRRPTMNASDMRGCEDVVGSDAGFVAGKTITVPKPDAATHGVSDLSAVSGSAAIQQSARAPANQHTAAPRRNLTLRI